MKSQSVLSLQSQDSPHRKSHLIGFAHKGRLFAILGAYLLLSFFASNSSLADEDQHTCVYISSYHRGFEWSDRVEAGLRAHLSDHCRIVQFDMDTKRFKDPEDILAAASAALELIRKEQPDVVITSDDNAARYLIVPHLLDTELPVVFSGINWTVEEYGFPAKNVTGIVEVAPLAPLISAASRAVPDARRVAYLSDETLTESKNAERYSRAADEAGIEIDLLRASTFEQWLEAFDKSQSYDFVIMGGVAGINNWNKEMAVSYVEKNTRVLTVTTHEWLMPYASLGYTLIPEEHGEWAGRTAAAIISGTSPGSIPIVTNRKWDTWINDTLIQGSDTFVSDDILRNAKQLRP